MTQSGTSHSHQSPVTSHQSSITNHQPSATNLHRPMLISSQLPHGRGFAAIACEIVRECARSHLPRSVVEVDAEKCECKFASTDHHRCALRNHEQTVVDRWI